MTRFLLASGAAISLVIAGCSQGESGDGADNTAASGEASKTGQGSDKTIAASLDQNSRFFQAAKAAGLDATLNGSEPYTVLVPDDAAFGKLPPGTTENLMKPESRAELTGLLTYHILPGVVLAEDIGKAIDNAKGKAVLATMGGGTVTATREGGNIVLTDSAGTKATVTAADQKHSNGVVHRIDAVLIPEDGQA